MTNVERPLLGVKWIRDLSETVYNDIPGLNSLIFENSFGQNAIAIQNDIASFGIV